MRIFLAIAISFFCILPISAKHSETFDSTIVADSVTISQEEAQTSAVPSLDLTDSPTSQEVSEPRKKSNIFKRIGSFLGNTFDYINAIDSSYIRPQEYNWAAMMQSTTTFESYRLDTKSGHEITFSPTSQTKIGPYGGWRWIFLGYTFDVQSFNIANQKDISLSFYTPIFNLDFIWRKSGDAYHIRKAILRDEDDAETFRNIPLSGLETTIRGINFNWIFNHKKFSYPAAFAQSSCQLKSAGAPIAGIGYIFQRLDLDHNKLQQALNDRLKDAFPDKDYSVSLDSTLRFNRVQHASISFSGGYAYNWVPKKNFLFAASLTAGIAFKKAIGDIEKDRFFSYRDFTLRNVNFDGCGRFAAVYNNMRWYAGASSIIHFYNYNSGQFHAANWYCTVSAYVGINFGRRKN